MIMVMVVRWLLLGLYLYLMGKLFRKIVAEYIFNPQLYQNERREAAPSQTFTTVCQKKAS
ncbi:MAG: hypothetical protein E7504_07050 [Ruminococcus sp.]|nr:hypothetical protein [Ruminococcus sp.]